MILKESKNLNSRNDEKPLIHIVKGGFLMKPKFILAFLRLKEQIKSDHAVTFIKWGGAHNLMMQ